MLPGLLDGVVLELIDPLQLIIQLHVVEGDVHQMLLIPACSRMLSNACYCPVGTLRSTAWPRGDSSRITVVGVVGVLGVAALAPGACAACASRRFLRASSSRARRCSDSRVLSMPMAWVRSDTAWLLPAARA